MFLTKIWSVLVTLWALAVTAGFLLATPPAEVQLEEAYEKQLDGAQGLVDSHMRMESRRRLDFFSEVGKDFKIIKLIKQIQKLEKKSKDKGKAVAKTLRIYLKQKLVGKGGEQAFKQRFDQVMFTDQEGTLWAVLGEHRQQVGDSVKGFPGVRRVLKHRVCSDDTIEYKGALHFVWSCPIRYVKHGAKVEFVGAVMGRKRIDDRFALSLLRLIGVSAAEQKKGDKGAGAKRTGAGAGKAEGKEKAKGKEKAGSKDKGKGKEKAGSKDKGKGKEKAKGKGKSGSKDKGKGGEASDDAEEKEGAGGKRLKIDIAFFHQGKIVAKSAKSKLWAQVGAVYKEHKKLVDKRTIGRSPAVELTEAGQRYLMVVGRLPGGAAGAGNVWAILWQYPAQLGPTAFLESKIPREELFRYMPWTLFIIGGVVALFLTVFFMYIEADRPIGKLLRQSRELAAGNLERLEDQQFRGRIGSIARSVNEAVERYQDAQPSRPPLHDKDLDSILGGPDVSEEDFSLGEESPTEAAAPVVGGAAATPPPPATPDADDADAPADGPPPPPPDLPPAPQPFGGGGGPPVTQQGPGPAVAGPPPAPPQSPEQQEEAAFRKVFEEFVATKQQCGEPTESLSFESFAGKLRKNKAAVLEKTGAKDVTFKVYIKEGKAALKASPVK